MIVRTPRSIVLSLGLALAWTSAAHAEPPAGWILAASAPTDYEVTIDSTTAATGKASALIVAKPNAKGFGTTMSPDAFRGARLRMSGYMKTEHALSAQMWMQVDGPAKTILAFDDMDSRPVTGTTEWKRYEIVLEVPQDSFAIAFGFFCPARQGLGRRIQVRKS